MRNVFNPDIFNLCLKMSIGATFNVVKFIIYKLITSCLPKNDVWDFKIFAKNLSCLNSALQIIFALLVL